MYIPSKDDLKLVPIIDLISELKTRHNDGFILAFMVDDPSFKDREYEILLDGSFANVNLLKEYLKRVIDSELDYISMGFEDINYDSTNELIDNDEEDDF
jgi:hypothetical protein